MNSATDQIMKVINGSPGCSLEDVVRDCPNLTWNQIFNEVDRMSRNGQIQLTMKSQGQYLITSAASPEPVGPWSED
jgi:hypothetical protein